MNQVVVVDYGIGNVFSVCNALAAAGADVVLSREKSTLLGAAKLILPGVGAFSKAKAALEDLELAPLLREFVDTGKPFLGICVGMQLMLDKSEEFGETAGLGYIPGRVVRIKDTATDGVKLRVPHISWRELRPPQEADYRRWNDTPLEAVEEGDKSTYFVHSFHAECKNDADVLAYVEYGGNRLTAAVRKDNLTGMQFHPERSGAVGQKILSRFLTNTK